MLHHSLHMSQYHQTDPWIHLPTSRNSHLPLPKALSQLRWPKEMSLTWAALNPWKQIPFLHAGSTVSILVVIKKENPKHYRHQGNKREQDTWTNQDYRIYVPEGRSTETLKEKMGSWRCHHNQPICGVKLQRATATAWHNHQTFQQRFSGELFYMRIWVLLLGIVSLSHTIQTLPWTCHILVCNPISAFLSYTQTGHA